jgi:hypothetical protein
VARAIEPLQAITSPLDQVSPSRLQQEPRARAGRGRPRLTPECLHVHPGDRHGGKDPGAGCGSWLRELFAKAGLPSALSLEVMFQRGRLALFSVRAAAQDRGTLPLCLALSKKPGAGGPALSPDWLAVAWVEKIRAREAELTGFYPEH